MLTLLHCRDRMNLKAPIYFSTGLTEKVRISASMSYHLFINWQSDLFCKLYKFFINFFLFTKISQLLSLHC